MKKNIPKRKIIRKIWVTILTTLTTITYITTATPYPANAVDLESDEYKIIDATISSGGETATSDNYDLHSTIGDFSSNPRLTSDSYTLKSGPVEIFTANVPLIQCFETDTDGSSDCQSPGYLASNGMVTVCGQGGCYDRARFEIDNQRNPPDTLYGIQVSIHPDFTPGTTNYVDATTFTATGSRELANFRTESHWENETFNLRGLNQSTNYYIRVSALHGDFTESQFSPAASSTTSNSSLSFDIDISGTTWSDSNPQHNINLSLEPNVTQKSSNLIWMTVGTNNRNGIFLAQNGAYGGLHGTSYEIESATSDLSTASTGFGLQDYPSAASGQYSTPATGTLTTLSAFSQYSANYNGATENVGIIDTSVNNIYEASDPLYSARSAMYIGAKIDHTVPGGNYSEIVTFWCIPR